MGIYTYCFVSGCPTSTKENPQEKFFYLPLNTDLLRKWVTNMGREDVLQKSSSYQRHRRICSVHFTRDCFQTAEKKKLNRGAVPTILAENAIPSMEIIPKLDEVLPGPFKNVRNPLVVVDVAAVQTQPLCTPSTSTELTPSIANEFDEPNSSLGHMCFAKDIYF